MENNQNMTLQQEMRERNASAEKNIWIAKMIFEGLAMVLAGILFLGFIDQLSYNNLAWEINGIVVLLAFLACGFMSSYLGRRCVNYYCGSYRCKKCGHIHFLSKSDIINDDTCLNKVHLECPQCGKKSWQRKVHLNAEQPVDQEK